MSGFSGDVIALLQVLGELTAVPTCPGAMNLLRKGGREGEGKRGGGGGGGEERERES